MTAVTPANLGIGRLFDTLADAVIVADLDRERIVLWNQAATTIFGFPTQDATGMALDVLVPPELRATHHDGISAYRATGHGALVDNGTLAAVPAMRADGSRIDIELRLSPLPTVDGARYVMAIVRDVTERTRLAAALAESRMTLQLSLEAEQAASARLRELIDVRDKMVRLVAHDLRTPLSVVLGFARLLRDDRLEGDQQAEAIRQVIDGAERLDQMMTDMLERASPDARTPRLDAQPFDLGAVLAGSVEELAAAHGTGRFSVSVPDGLPAANGDAARHRLAATAIVAHAAGWSPPDRPVEITVSVDGPQLAVAVRDHGPGMTPEEQSRLFQKCARADGPGTEGTLAGGLGLYIAGRLILNQGGTVEVESAPGQGTTIRYTVPCQPGAENPVR